MKLSLLVACGPIALVAGATAIACAESENSALGNPPLDPSSEMESTDSGSSQVDADDKKDVETARCSPAGWCVTALPDANLEMKHMWMLSHRAFALAESKALGAKVLEWDDAEAKWSYIDDGTQNDTQGNSAVSTIQVGKIWAPNDNEVYYAVSPGYVYHGTRSAAPPTSWSWTRHRLGDATNRAAGALGVWGTSSSDVYAWSDDTIYHWTSVDGGAPDWVAEYVATDVDVPGQSLTILGAVGSSPDEVWFSGGRTGTSTDGCAILVRRTPTAYQRVADGVVDGPFCTERAGALLIGGAVGPLTDIQMPTTNQLVGLKANRDVVKISVEEGRYSVAVATIPQALFPQAAAVRVNSLSVVGDHLWLAAAGLVIRGTNVWDGGTFELSTISLNGGPFQRPIYQVQGTSNTNLWAIGSFYALHKTTP